MVLGLKFSLDVWSVEIYYWYIIYGKLEFFSFQLLEYEKVLLKRRWGLKNFYWTSEMKLKNEFIAWHLLIVINIFIIFFFFFFRIEEKNKIKDKDLFRNPEVNVKKSYQSTIKLNGHSPDYDVKASINIKLIISVIPFSFTKYNRSNSCRDAASYFLVSFLRACQSISALNKQQLWVWHGCFSHSIIT